LLFLSKIIKMKSIFLLFTLIICNSSFSQKPELITQEKNLGVITCIKYSSDGRYIASGSDKDYKVKIWDVQSGKLVGTLSGHTKFINDIAFHPNGKTIVSASSDMKNYVWDLNTWSLVDSISYSKEVVKFNYSVKGDRIIAGTTGGNVVFWNSSDYHTVIDLGKAGGEINSLLVSENIIAASSARHDMVIWDAKTKRKLKKVKPIGATEIVGITLVDNKLIYGGEDGKIRVMDLATFKNILTFKAHNSITTIGSNSKRKIIASAGNDKTLKIWSLETGELITTFHNSTLNSQGKEIDEKVRQIIFSPEGGMLATSGYKTSIFNKTRSKDNTIKLYDVDRRKLYKTLKGEVRIPDAYCFHTTENYFYTLNDSLLKIWDLNIGESVGDFVFHERKKENALTNEDEKAETKTVAKKKTLSGLNKFKDMALSGNVPTVKVDPNKIKQKTAEVGGNISKRVIKNKNTIYISSKGKYMLTKFVKDEYRLYAMNNGVPEYQRYLKAKIKGGVNGFAMSPNEDVIVFIGGGENGISILDLESGSITRTLHSGKIDKVLYEARSVSFSRDGAFMAVVSNLGVITIWDTSNWMELTTVDLKGGVRKNAYIHFGDNSDQLFVQTLIGVFSIDLKTFLPKRMGSDIEGNPLTLSQPSNYIVSQDKKGLYFYNIANKTKSQIVGINVKMIAHVEMNKYGYVGVSLKNGELKIIDPETGKERFTMVTESDNAIFKTPSNYYKITKKGTDLVTFRVGKDAYPFEQFDAKFNRPDIVLKAMNSEDEGLVALYEKAYSKRLKKLGISESELSGDMNLPTISILNRNELPVITSERKVILKLKGNDENNSLSKVNIWLNDVPVQGANGVKISGNQFADDIEVDLAAGLNKIQVSITNSKGGESLKQTVEIDCEVEVKRNLYVISVGTSAYKDKRFNLNYAAKDANDLAGLLNESNDVYSSIYQKVLTDQEVLKDNFKALKSFLKGASIDDVVLVFIAGHGVLDSEYDYYYGTHNIDFNNPQSYGLKYAEIENVLDGIKPLRKLLIMDTCHSGEVEKDEVEEAETAELVEGDIMFRSVGNGVKDINEDGVSPSKMMKELFSDLRRGTGTTVITSAGGTEFAMESAEWKNGLFTYCLLSGLRNRTADINKDGKIMLSELQFYVTDKVSKLSHGRQVPTSRIQNIALDYQIW